MVIFHQKNTIFFSWNHYSPNKICTKTLFACHSKRIAKHIYLSNYSKCWLQRKYNFKLLIMLKCQKNTAIKYTTLQVIYSICSPPSPSKKYRCSTLEIFFVIQTGLLYYYYMTICIQLSLLIWYITRL